MSKDVASRSVNSRASCHEQWKCIIAQWSRSWFCRPAITWLIPTDRSIYRHPNCWLEADRRLVRYSWLSSYDLSMRIIWSSYRAIISHTLHTSLYSNIISQAFYDPKKKNLTTRLRNTMIKNEMYRDIDITLKVNDLTMYEIRNIWHNF